MLCVENLRVRGLGTNKIDEALPFYLSKVTMFCSSAESNQSIYPNRVTHHQNLTSVHRLPGNGANTRMNVLTRSKALIRVNPLKNSLASCLLASLLKLVSISIHTETHHPSCSLSSVLPSFSPSLLSSFQPAKTMTTKHSE